MPTAIYVYTAAALLSIFFFCIVMRIWNIDLTVPLVYVEDGLGPLLEVKNMLDGNDVYHYTYLNAPFDETTIYGVKGYNLYLPLFRFMLLFTEEIGLIINIFYFSTYIFTTLSMLFVLRNLKIKDEVALLGSVLYSFLPYHFLRNEMHLFVGTYIFVPFAVYATLLLYTNTINGKKKITSFLELNKSFFVKKNIWPILGCFLLGASDIYFSFFAAILLVFSGFISLVRYKKKRNLYYMALFLLLLIVPICINSMPALIHHRDSDIGIFAGNRSLYDIDRYGVRISQLLLPITDHRIPFLANLRKQFNTAGFMYLLETNMNSLGLFMSLGFLIGVFLLFINKKKRIFAAAAHINIFIVLLAGIGGFNIFVGMFVTYYIRAYCRIVVYIAAYSSIIICLCMSIALDKIYNRVQHNIKHKCFFVTLCIVLTFLGVLDQTSESYAYGTDFDYVYQYASTLEELKDEWDNDKHFIAEIEREMPEGALIFEMPVLYPEELSNNVFNNGKQHTDRFLRPYLHSQNLHWSYPYVNNSSSYASIWQNNINNLPLNDMLTAIMFSGFSGIYIDSYSLSPEECDGLIAHLITLTGQEPLISNNEMLYFFNLEPCINNMKCLYKDSEWNAQKIDWLYRYEPIPSYTFESDNLYYMGYTGKNNSSNNGSVYLDSGALQFGPYISLEDGMYNITVFGENFGETTSVSCTADGGMKQIEVKELNCTPQMITYQINLENAEENIEFLLKNNGSEKIFISSVTCQEKYVKSPPMHVLEDDAHELLVYSDQDCEERISLHLSEGSYIMEIAGQELNYANITAIGIVSEKEINEEKLVLKNIYETTESSFYFFNILSACEVKVFSNSHKYNTEINELSIYKVK